MLRVSTFFLVKVRVNPFVRWLNPIESLFFISWFAQQVNLQVSAAQWLTQRRRICCLSTGTLPASKMVTRYGRMAL